MQITSFTGENGWLSNFWPCEVSFEGQLYPSVEHAYQAAKTNDLEMREKIRLASKPAEAKRLGRLVSTRPDWEAAKLGVMRQLLLQKFTRNEDLKAKLLATGNTELIEGNWWGDRFWGVCRGEGLNHLGKSLMYVRGLVG